MLPDLGLYTDLYQLTMAQGYLQRDMGREMASFNMFFRNYPFKGGYAIFCGAAQLASALDSFKYDQNAIDYLAGLKTPGGKPMFTREFLRELLDMRLNVQVWAAREGDLVFPHEPIVRVEGPIYQCQLIETMLLNIINFETLIATKAARVCNAAGGRAVAEFGLRRAQGTGGLWASRAAIVGGCASTSNVLAGQMFDLPVSGTHAHSWVMGFESEISAFRAFAASQPTNCVLLVDTYDVVQGVKNAICVGLEMREAGEHLSGIRIDSGDLAWTTKLARKMLDDAGLFDTKIVVSNDLDEYTVKSILDEGAPIDSFGVGTKLASAYDQPSLGGVYKLSAIKDNSTGEWTDRIKISETAAKLTMPGVLNVRRYYTNQGRLAGDMVYDINHAICEGEVIVDPTDDLRQKKLDGLRFCDLLHPLFEGGRSVLPAEYTNALAARERARAALAQLDETQKRILNPHTYPVGLEAGLHARRQDLVMRLKYPGRSEV